MIRSGSLLLLAAFGLAQTVDAETRRYRLSWRDNPSTSMVVGWETISGSGATVYYDTIDHGTNWSAYANSRSVDRTTSAKGMTHQFARLSGLQANTAYYFVIRDSDSTSSRYWFKTAPSTPTPFSIVAGGDSRNNRTPRQNGNRIVAKLRPLFVSFGGDYTDSNSNSQWANWFDDWQLTISSDGRMYPIMAARGNHDDNTSIYNMFDTPSSSVYFAQTIGGTHLRAYTLNSEITEGGSQGSWLANDLSTTGQAMSFRIAQYHKPMRPHTSSKSEGNNEYNAWAQTFYDYNMDLVVESDTHMVKRTHPVRPSTGGGSDEGFIRDDATGTFYVGEGCWGAPLRSANDGKNWTRALGSFNQVQWIHVHLDRMEVRTIQTDNATSVGSVSDSNPFTAPSNLSVWSPSGGSVITINARGTGGGNIPPVFAADPISKSAADEGQAYSNSIAGDASDANGDSLTFAKVSGSSWLNVASNGALSGTPGANDVGSNAFTVSVDDSNGGSDTATLNINVISVNGGGEFTVSFQQGVDGYNGTQDTYLRFASANTNHGSQSDLQIDGADSGGEIHTLIRFDNLDSLIPAGADILSATLEISVYNPGNSANFHRMMVGWNESSTWNSMSNGISANSSEAASSSDVTTGSLGTGIQSYDVTNSVTAWIENGQSNYGWAMLPTGTDGIDFDSSESGNAPKLTVTYFSSGNGGSGSNSAPEFSNSSYSDSATEDLPYSVSMADSATDADGDSLTYSKSTGPAWLNVAVNGTLSGTPTQTNVGSNVFTISVADGNGGSDSATLTINVANVNDAPAFTSSTYTNTATVGTFFSGTFNGLASDEDGDSLSFSKVSGPAWLSVASNGTHSGTPSASDEGANNFVIEVTDGNGGSNTATLNITVNGGSSITPTDSINFGDEWKYNDNGSNLGTAWRSNSYNDGAWPIGNAQLGYGDGDESTNLAGSKITYYFRRPFNVADASAITSLDLNLLFDDGAVVYINGNEVYRTTTMPSGTISYNTVSGLASDNQTESASLNLATAALVNGTNIIAVEVHNQSTSSSDISFNLALTAGTGSTGGGSFEEVNFNNFESGWGICNDGGSDCRRSSNDASYANGTYCVRLRDNTSTSVMTTDNLALSGKNEVKVEFSYYPRSMDNSNEDFWLQISTNGGSSYTTVEEWNRGNEFENNNRYNDEVIISGVNLNNNVRLRFRCDASANGDQVYIDDVRISAK